MILTAPTGIYTTVYRNKIVISWVKNPETNVAGYNVYNSMTSGGGISGYTKLNSSLIEEYSEVQKLISSTETVVTEVGGVRTTTTVDHVADVYIFTYEHSNLTEAKKQYYVITAVDTLGVESPWSIEAGATPLLVPTDVYNPPIRSQNDVSLDYITTILEKQPKLDVKPGSVTRQLHIDPNSYEFYLDYIRLDFASRAQSLLTLRQLDDSDGDGISDDVATSTYKQLLKTAFFYTNDADVQTLIDTAFDKIGSNYNKYRKGATVSNVSLVFYTATPITKDITVPLNTQSSTMPSETTSTVVFQTLAEATMEVAYINNYYNPMTLRYELPIQCEALIAGSAGNVNSDTIISSTIAGLNVTNPLHAFGGRDQESNSDFADRIELSFVGLDVGTKGGYERTARETIGVEDVIVVMAGDPMMQRDYDEVRKKHVFGKVDVYVRGGVASQVQDTFGFLFNKSTNEAVTILDAVDMVLRVDNPIVLSKPVFYVQEIINVSQAKNYDLLGNWRIFKNSIEMVKGTEVNMTLDTGVIAYTDALTAGDVITASYDYKASFSETLIDPALGGENSFLVTNIPVIKRSYVVMKNSIALTEITDYTINLYTGNIILTNGLVTGDALTIDYQYKVTIAIETVNPNAIGNELNDTILSAALPDFMGVLESLIIQDGYLLDLDHTNYKNASIGMSMSDSIITSYRYRDSNPYVMLNQPVDDVISVTGSVSGELTKDVNWFFNKTDDVLLEGNSTKAVRNISFAYANNTPVGNILSATDSIVLINNEFKELTNKGIDTDTIVVKDGTATYIKNVDYLVKTETSGNNVMLSRAVTSTIPNGGTVQVLYDYGELMTIVYTVNPLIATVQANIDVSRYITADVLVKNVIETYVDYEIAVILKKGSDEIALASSIKDAISTEMAKLKTGQSLAQSDVIRVVEEVSNVVSVIVPLAKMVKADGTFINREPIYTAFTTYQTSTVTSYTTGKNALIYKTLGSVGTDGFYCVFENDIPLTFVSTANDVDTAAGQAFITANGEVIVSTIDGDSPDTHLFTVSYVVTGETGSKDIPASVLEHLNPGSVSIITSIQQQ